MLVMIAPVTSESPDTVFSFSAPYSLPSLRRGRFVSVLFVGQCGLRCSDAQAVCQFTAAAVEVL